jgi:hypothetical protein
LEGPEVINRCHPSIKFTLVFAATYGSGILLSAALGVLYPYITSIAFVIGAAGVGWVVTSVPTRTRMIDQLYMKVLPTFGGSQNAAEREIEQMFAKACSSRHHLGLSAIIMILITFALFSAVFLYPVKILEITIISLRPIWFSAELYTSGAGLPGFFIIGFFGALISISMGTSLWLMFAELRILKYLGTLPVPPLPEAVRVALRPLADFHVRVARDWSIGALLFVFLFFSNADVMSLGLVGLITIVAACIFAVPQIRLRSIVLRAHRRAVEMVLASWNQGAPAQHDVGKNPTFLADLTTISTPPGYWVYGSGQVLMWIIAQVTAAVALVLQFVASGP